jgi:hypothetical protein
MLLCARLQCFVKLELLRALEANSDRKLQTDKHIDLQNPHWESKCRLHNKGEIFFATQYHTIGVYCFSPVNIHVLTL